MIEIPCNYQQSGSKPCNKGELFIYGDLPIPPQTIVCPKCKGSGFIQVEESYIKDLIKRYLDTRKTINEELQYLRRLLRKSTENGK